MLAYRTRWLIKKGRVQEAMDLLQGPLEAFRERGIEARIYSNPQKGRRRVVVWEETWENAETHDAFWAEDGEAHTAEAAKEFWSKWDDVVDGKSKHRVWTLHK